MPAPTRFVSAATEATRLRHRLALAYFAMVCLVVVFVAGLVAVSRHRGADAPVPASTCGPFLRVPPTKPSPSVPTLVAPR
jgi:hypothetical protein